MTGRSGTLPGHCAAAGLHRQRRAARQWRYHARMERPAPLILADVDGVLNPGQPEAGVYRRHWVFPGGIPRRLSLHPMHGQMLSELAQAAGAELARARDRKSTRLNSSHMSISYAVFCLKKKK